MRTTRVTATALGLILFCICLSANISYGLGGGGHHGDGRWGFPQPATPANSNSSGFDVQQARTEGSYSGSCSASTFIVQDYRPFVQEPVTIPEPIAALLLGLGAIGLVSMRRKFSK